MINRPICQQVTRRGRPCRNPALPDSDPPRCARHRSQPDDAVQYPLPGLVLDPGDQPAPQPVRAAKRHVPDMSETHQPRLPGYWAWELAELELDGLSSDLRQEIQQVRVTILRLLRLWDNPAQPLTSEETRRLATLIFSGARTVAHLLSRQTEETDATEWLAQALATMGSKYDLDL